MRSKIAISLISCLFLVGGKFIPIRGHFVRKKIKFDYLSKVEQRMGVYWVVDSVYCGSRKPICLAWPSAQMCYNNKKPVQSEVGNDFPVTFPHYFHFGAILFGSTLKDTVNNIDCYVDEKSLRLDKSGEYSGSVGAIDETGNRIYATVSSKYYPNLQSALLEINVAGNSTFLVAAPQYENTLTDSTKRAWNLSSIKDLSTIFASKGEEQMSQFLQTSSGYLQFKKKDKDSQTIAFLIKTKEPKINDMKMCVISEDGSQSIGFITKILY